MYDILFCRTGQDTRRWEEAIYRGPGASQLWEQWEQTQAYFLSLRQFVGPLALDMTEDFRVFDEKASSIQRQLEEHQELKVQIWPTRKGIYRKKELPDVRDVKMEEKKT